MLLYIWRIGDVAGAVMNINDMLKLETALGFSISEIENTVT